MIIGSRGMEDGFDVATLVGAALTSIRFDHHQLQLHFDPHLRIFIENDFRIALANGTDEVVEEIPTGASLAGALLSMVITRADLTDDLTLTVHFDRGALLELYSERRVHPLPFPYESYQVIVDDEWFVA